MVMQRAVNAWEASRCRFESCSTSQLKTMIKCKRHGLTESISNGVNRRRCKQCRNDAVAERRRRVKRMLVEYKGGKCVRCGYSKCVAALDFHHENEKEKAFGISHKGHTISFERLKKEADKCVLLCANCHREEHAEELLAL